MKGTAILIIYTGGTIGMKRDLETGSLVPFNFKQIQEEVPELAKFNFRLDTISYDPPVDSSNIQPEFWVSIADIIKANYQKYDGFVILHGTDTMSYTATALSFMIQNLTKPIILTGSQLPIGEIRTDGRENLLSAVEVAAAYKEGKPLIPEVCILFNNHLYRGNRTFKYNAHTFNAFRSENYPALAVAGIDVQYHLPYVRKVDFSQPVVFNTKLEPNVASLTLFPGINQNVVHAILNIKGIKGVVLETFGSGNAPTYPWFIDELESAIKRGLVVVNVTQCRGGAVNMESYETGVLLKKMGVITGEDITFEAAIVKLMYLFGQSYSYDEVKEQFQKSLAGEIGVG
jgi:L-asparaginase